MKPLTAQRTYIGAPGLSSKLTTFDWYIVLSMSFCQGPPPSHLTYICVDGTQL